VYDRPFLWGSKRTGPDLAREGGKYPDGWHYEHFKDPRQVIPESNMPAYAWLSDNKVDPAYAERKMNTLGFPYTPREIQELSGKTEMDALVAYMQKLGADFKKITAAKAAAAAPATAVGSVPVKNPHSGDATAAMEGEVIFVANCSACHGKNLEGGIGPKLAGIPDDDADLFKDISIGKSGGMPPFKSSLGDDKIWKVVTFLKSGLGAADAAGHGHH